MQRFFDRPMTQSHYFKALKHQISPSITIFKVSPTSFYGNHIYGSNGPYQSQFAVRNSKKSPNQETVLGIRRPLDALIDTKMNMSDSFNHSGSIWYQSEPLEVSYFQTRFLVWTFFAVSYSKLALVLKNTIYRSRTGQVFITTKNAWPSTHDQNPQYHLCLLCFKNKQVGPQPIQNGYSPIGSPCSLQVHTYLHYILGFFHSSQILQVYVSYLTMLGTFIAM